MRLLHCFAETLEPVAMRRQTQMACEHPDAFMP